MANDKQGNGFNYGEGANDKLTVDDVEFIFSQSQVDHDEL
jgi:hypothetical protein